jgi:hypothetical protein
VEEMLARVFEESGEDTLEGLKETREEASQARTRRKEAVPSAKEVEEHNLDHSVFRSWCPHSAKGRAEAYRHRSKKEGKREAQVVGLDYASRRRRRSRVCPWRR